MTAATYCDDNLPNGDPVAPFTPNTTTVDGERTPGGYPGAAVTRGADGNISSVDLDGADAWQQQQNQSIAQSGFNNAANGSPIQTPAAPNPPAMSKAQQQDNANQCDALENYSE